MATEIFRKKFLEVYRQRRQADQFLASFFLVRPGNISDTEKVALDIVRNDEDISPVVNTCEGPTFNTSDTFTTKEWTPPTIDEAMPFNCKEFLKRMAGMTEYEAAGLPFQAQLVERIMDGMDLLENKIRRNIESQASQILQGGILNLKDENGNVVYTINFLAKATHNVAAGVSWAGGGGDPESDIDSMAGVIRDDSLQDADVLVFGNTAWRNFIANPDITSQLDNRRMQMGEVRPTDRGQGATFQGFFWIGSYRYEMWTYTGRGIDPGSTTKVQFVAPNNVIVMASSGRLDKVFGGVPILVDTDERFTSILPGRVSVPQAVDISPNIYTTPNGRDVILELMSRPLLIPTGIDSFGTIDAT